MENLNAEQINDILDKMDFFQGQRAGRELWNDKPFDVQEQDIANFSRDIALIKGYIKKLTAENKTLKTELEFVLKVLEVKERSYELLSRAYDLVIKANKCSRADDVRKMKERFIAEIEQTPNANEHFIEAWKSKIDQIAKEMEKGKNEN